MQKILVLTFNYEPSQFPRQPDESNRFYTYGFGGMFGKLFHKLLEGYEIEVWRVDNYITRQYYEKSVEGIKFRVFKSKRINKLGLYSRAFIKELKREQNENSPIFFVVHTHNWQTYQIAYWLKGAKIITTHHGDWSPFFVYQQETGMRKLKARINMFIEKRTFKNISFFLLCDHNQVPYVKMSAPQMEYLIFTAGLDINKFKLVEKNEARKSLGWSPEKKYLLYVGKLYKYKQIAELLKIWKEIKKDRPEVELVLAGNEAKGTWGEEYYEMAEQYGATIVGRVLNTELYNYYCAADAYVLMALREDNFGGIGIAPLESLACNTPVITYSLRNYLGDNTAEIGEMPDTLEGYKKAIIKVLDNRDNYCNMRESVEKYYSWESVIKRLEIVFNRVLEKEKGL